MTQTALFAAEPPPTDATAGRFYLGMENGKPAYALLNEAGEMKFHWKCPHCKKQMHIWSPWRQAPGCPPTADDNATAAHLRACTHAGEWIRKFMARFQTVDGQVHPHNRSKYPTMEALKADAMRVAAHFAPPPQPFRWLKVPGGGHACNGKCMCALGPDCSCSCGGRNHGICR